MARGPLPNPEKRRRNAPTIPTTELPASGRQGPAPDPPYELAEAGRIFWGWAWSKPQALAWDDGALYTVARRAALEDDLAMLERSDGFDLAELLGLDENEAVKQLQFVIGRLKSMAGGRTGVMKEMRELDNRLGLNPKGLADLRWTIVADEGQEKPKPEPAASASERRARLSVVG